MVKVTMVIIKPANEIPHPIHVITCNSSGFAAVCETSNRMAKFVKWSHSQNTLVAVLFTKEHPLVDHFPFPLPVEIKKGRNTRTIILSLFLKK